MTRSYYNAKIAEFLNQNDNYILGELARNNQFDLNDLQRNTWLQEIAILKECLQSAYDKSKARSNNICARRRG